jgi:hypothetical protein
VPGAGGLYYLLVFAGLTVASPGVGGPPNGSATPGAVAAGAVGAAALGVVGNPPNGSSIAPAGDGGTRFPAGGAASVGDGPPIKFLSTPAIAGGGVAGLSAGGGV